MRPGNTRAAAGLPPLGLGYVLMSERALTTHHSPQRQRTTTGPDETASVQQLHCLRPDCAVARPKCKELKHVIQSEIPYSIMYTCGSSAGSRMTLMREHSHHYL